MARTVRLGLMALVVCWATAGSAAAQLTTGTLTGTVKDAQGGVVPGATVTITSDTRGTSLGEQTTDGTGNYTFVNVPVDTYTIEVALTGFRNSKRAGVRVSAGDRLSIPVTIEVGGASETLTVTAEAPIVQTQSAERSLTISTEAVENLPIPNRSFTQLASLAPGTFTDPTQTNARANRLGGGGANNFVMDGVVAVDTGSNSPLIQTSVESIKEVKVLVSNYQAEFGRFSGLQVAAITKSGSNRFSGGFYDVERNSHWNATSRVTALNGDPGTLTKYRDWGYSVGGPVGRPGGNNKLFFFYTQEYSPRTSGNDVQRFRVPTLLERQGDFSASTNELGNPITPTNLGSLYGPGLAILNAYPLPNTTAGVGQPYNLIITRPEESVRSTQPVIRLDYQASPNLRGTFKYTGWTQSHDLQTGTVPGFNDAIQQNPKVYTFSAQVNYVLNSTTVIDATYGRSQNELAGCALAQGGGEGGGGGPTFCRQNGIPMTANASRLAAGLGGVPLLYPGAYIVDPRTYTYSVLNGMSSPVWDGTQILIAPTFQWGSRVPGGNNAPPAPTFPGFLNINTTQDFSINLSKIVGRHTIKTGYYNSHTLKAQSPGTGANQLPFQGIINFGESTNNPLDTGFAFSNAATGVFQQYTQLSSYVESNFIYNNREAFIQDNWRVNDRLTLDYGIRFVHQQPAYDAFNQGSNFLTDQYSLSQATRLYVAGCGAGAVPTSYTGGPAGTCSGQNRRAYDPVSGQFLPLGSSAAIGTVVPGTGNALNGLVLPGQGDVPNTLLAWPVLSFGPRFGMAYDVTGEQKIVVRGGMGWLFDRPAGNVCNTCANPPTATLGSVRNANLANLGGGTAISAAPALNAFVPSAGLPTSVQWNAGMQMALRSAFTFDVEYVGSHAYNTPQNVNINSVDLGSAYLASNRDTTLAGAAGTNNGNGSLAVPSDQMRAIKGYGNITRTEYTGWRTFHSIQFSLDRRMRNGLAFGFNDTVPLYDHQSQAPRLQHNPDGSFFVRDDQAKAEEMLGTMIANRNIMKANATWSLPSFPRGDGAMRQGLSLALSDWQLSGVWTGVTGAAYSVTASIPSNGNVNLTGSPDFAARVALKPGVNLGGGCSSDPNRQFNPFAFDIPQPGSDGLESRNDYLRGCFIHSTDLSLARTIRLGRGRDLMVRLDAYNAFNQSEVINRNTTMQVTSLSNPTITNLPFSSYDANGNATGAPVRTTPANAGFGVATQYQAPRSLQFTARFGF